MQPEVREQEVVVVVEEASDTATRARQESVSSESESDEEAEYQPNLPSPISHTLIPEEKEEEVEEVEREEQGEQEKGVEPAPITKETAPHPIEASQSAQDVEERENGAEEEKGETDDSTEDPMMTPDEVPNGHALPEEEAPGMAALAEEEEAKVNGESPMADSEPRPQVICCSEVINPLGQSWHIADLLVPPTNPRHAHYPCIPQPSTPSAQLHPTPTSPIPCTVRSAPSSCLNLKEGCCFETYLPSCTPSSYRE